jgi:hypothetical protein
LDDELVFNISISYVHCTDIGRTLRDMGNAGVGREEKVWGKWAKYWGIFPHNNSCRRDLIYSLLKSAMFDSHVGIELAAVNEGGIWGYFRQAFAK